MDIKKEIYLLDNKYYGKISTTPSTNESNLFLKYKEPTVAIGGTFTDGTTSFTLSDDSVYVHSNNPHTRTFDPLTLSVSLDECGKRATAFVNTMVTRIETVMDTLRGQDATTYEIIKTITI